MAIYSEPVAYIRAMVTAAVTPALTAGQRLEIYDDNGLELEDFLDKNPTLSEPSAYISYMGFDIPEEHENGAAILCAEHYFIALRINTKSSFRQISKAFWNYMQRNGEFLLSDGDGKIRARAYVTSGSAYYDEKGGAGAIRAFTFNLSVLTY